SMPCHYDDSPLNGHETEGLPLELRPGSPAKDAPIGLAGRRAWLLNQLGDRFTLLLDGRVDSARAETLRAELEPLLARQTDLDLLIVGPAPHALAELSRSTLIEDAEAQVGERYGLTGGVGYLIRPDQHVCARWRQVIAADIETALDRALGRHLNAEEARHATA
ncbi:MAG: FAD-dependent oxidoreductase, partial [Halomonas sp.]|nr:FAD-dependent oxidoreductase [Halomonas sp.]